MTGQQSDSDQTPVQAAEERASLLWVDMATAAEQMGVTTEALRQRIRRGTIVAEKRRGRWFVAVPEVDRLRPDSDRFEPGEAVQTEVVQQLREEVSWLRQRLEQAEEERAEMRRLLAQAQQVHGARLLPEPNAPVPPDLSPMGDTSPRPVRPVDRPVARPVPRWRRLWEALTQR